MRLTKESVRTLLGKKVVAVLNTYSTRQYAGSNVGIVGVVTHKIDGYYVEDTRKAKDAPYFRPDLDNPDTDELLMSVRLFPTEPFEEGAVVTLSEDGKPQEIYTFKTRHKKQ